MIESVLTRKNVSVKLKITVKMLVSAGIIALAIGLPQLVHAVAGAQGGARWLPMYLPVLLGGCLLGWQWGLGIGIVSPLLSFGITSLAGNAMPVAVRLPYMVAELAVFDAISGVFSKRIAENSWMAFPAVLSAAVGGRTLFMTVAAVFQSVSPLSAAAVWSQIQTGLVGLVLQATLVPIIVMILSFAINNEKRVNND